MPRSSHARIEELHPTQLTVGMIEVREKRHHLSRLGQGERREFMEAHPMPVVAGPRGRLYLVDHHHLALSALEAGVEQPLVEVQADLSSRRQGGFWEEMDRRGWVHPLDENGVRHRYTRIPRRLGDLVDDVYRSLARYVRIAGGFEKSQALFVEFVWADFFRRHLAIEDVRADFDRLVKRAVPLARSGLARRMPGFRGRR